MGEMFCEIPVKIDFYNGLTIDLFQLPEKAILTQEEFENNIKASLNRWINVDQRRCVWFRVPRRLSQFITVLVKHGFEFHHAKSNFVMLIRWICEKEPIRIPKFAHTTIGVGGLVYHSKTNKVLLVKEKNSLIKMWKFPGGYSEPKEDIGDTAIREVMEETGVECSLKSMISFRHRHDGIFSCSDFYFVCLLVPVEKEFTIKTCQFEIEDCQWFDLDEARKHLCGFNKYVFEEFLKQYLLLEYSKDTDNGQTINTEIIHSNYGPYKRNERVYSIRKSTLID